MKNIIDRLGISNLDNKKWALLLNGGEDLERKRKVFGERLLLSRMGRINGVGTLNQFLAIRCQVFEGVLRLLTK